MLIMYMIVTLLGVYLLYLSIKMKKSGKIERFIIPEEVIAKCKDEKKAAIVLSKALMLSSIVFIIGGIILTLNEFLFELGMWSYPVIAVVVLAFVYFYKILTDVKIKYC